MSKKGIKGGLKKLKRYFWHGMKFLVVVVALGLKHISKWFTRNIKGKLIRWVNKIDRLDTEWREDDLVIDILRYTCKKIFDIHRYIRNVRNAISEIKKFLRPPEGTLSWKRVMQLSGRNILNGKARVWVTVGGVAVGIGAIVLLVSFGYGLQDVVTRKIIWPDALKVAEVSSESSAVKIDQEMLQKIEGISKVKKIAPSIRLAGQMTFNASRMDVVIEGVNVDYFALSDLKMVKGSLFSSLADKTFVGEAQLPDVDKQNMGMVAGVATAAAEIKYGDAVDTKDTSFRLRDETYVAVFAKPKKTAAVIGYVKGSVIQSYQGNWVWGGVYEDISGLGRVQNESGQLLGKWIKASVPLWQDIGSGVYQEKSGADGSQLVSEGYLTGSDVTVLTAEEKRVEELLNDREMVLGEATDSASASSSADASIRKVGSASAQLATELAKTEIQQQETAVKDVVVQVRGDNEKELMVSSALVRAWNKKPEEVIGSDVAVEYIVTSNIMPSISGRIFSDKTKYRIVGVFTNDSQPVAYVPIGDIESMGVKTYSSVKVLAVDEASLATVRGTIQSMGLVTRSVADTLSQIVKLFTIIRFLLGSFGAIALLVALFGMFNTLTVSLLERTREIGVMKSLGTTNFDVKRIFMMESVLISGGGGVLGVLFGVVLGKFLEPILFHSAITGGQKLFVMPWTFGVSIVVLALLVGIVTGWYPARRAAKISALNALRYE